MPRDETQRVRIQHDRANRKPDGNEHGIGGAIECASDDPHVAFECAAEDARDRRAARRHPGYQAIARRPSDIERRDPSLRAVVADSGQGQRIAADEGRVGQADREKADRGIRGDVAKQVLERGVRTWSGNDVARGLEERIASRVGRGQSERVLLGCAGEGDIEAEDGGIANERRLDRIGLSAADRCQGTKDLVQRDEARTAARCRALKLRRDRERDLIRQARCKRARVSAGEPSDGQRQDTRGSEPGGEAGVRA